MNKPYLIQRMDLREEPKGKNFDGIVTQQYMGSSEFEWGALPDSLKVMCSNADELVISKTVYAKEENGVKTGVFLVTIGKEAALEYNKLLPDIYNDSYCFKEPPWFKESLEGKDDFFSCDAWWDIENHVMWVIGKKNAKQLIKAIKTTRDNKKVEDKKGWF